MVEAYQGKLPLSAFCTDAFDSHQFVLSNELIPIIWHPPSCSIRNQTNSRSLVTTTFYYRVELIPELIQKCIVSATVDTDAKSLERDALASYATRDNESTMQFPATLTSSHRPAAISLVDSNAV